MPYFTANDAYFANPNDPRNRYSDPNDALYKGDLFRQGAPACTETADPDTCVPAFYVPQFDPQNLAGTPKVGGPGGFIDPADVYREDTGYSEANALDASPLNQTVFAAVCAGTVGFASLDPSACALNVFSSTNFLPGLGGTQLVSILGKFLMGDTGINTLAGPNIAGVATPLVTLFRDQWTLNAPQYEILQTADNFDPDNPQIGQPFPRSAAQIERDDWSETEDGFVFARELQDYDQAGCFNPYTLNQPAQSGGSFAALGFGRVCDFDDLATSSASRLLNNTNAGHAQLNSVLTPEQEAILGCGPFFGTNCSQNGIDFLWMEMSAVLQTFPGIEGTEDLSGQGWRNDGLQAGEKTMVTGSLTPCADARAAGSDLVCRMVNGRETVVELASPYFGLAEEDIPLLFQGWKDNCSTWLGRTNDNRGDTDPVTGWNCVKRYGQPGTIGARHIGTGEILTGAEAPNSLYAGFSADSDFQNFEMDQAGPRCPTSPFGGTEDQVLPGCRRKWANFQGDYVFLTDDLTPTGTPLTPRPNLNLYGRDRDCMELPDPTSDVRCSQVRAAAVDPSDPSYDEKLATMRPGTVLGGYASARYDDRSWDVTKDGDPDNVGFDSWLLTDLTAQINAFHPAILYRTGHYCHAPAGPNNAGRTGVCNPSNHYGSQKSQSMVVGYDTVFGGSVPRVAANPLFPGGGQGVVYSAASGNRYPVAQIYSQIPGEGLQDIWRSNQCNNGQLAPGQNYANAQGLPQCAQFQRAAQDVAVIGASTTGPGSVLSGQPFAVASQGSTSATFVGGTEETMPVYAQGVGHPFTGQPWSNELAGASWNFLQALVASSAQYRNLGISRALLFDPGTGPPSSFCPRSDPFGEKCRVAGVSISEFPGRFANPLAYATFDVSDPANRTKLEEIRAIEAELEVLYGNPNDAVNQDAINSKLEEARLVRADMAPICSLVTTKECGTVSALMGLAGQGSPVVRAGGNGTYGRRCAIWSCGGVITLDYDKRNVLGFGADFAEDYTKSNWGLEWTWIPDVAVGDSASMSGVSRVDTFNLTISVDRPTFINFLNANRTFFITSQWFFQYIDGYKKSFGSPRGPFNVLGILFIQTGYFQDRLLPKLTLVYDVKSVSAAAIIDFTYRYNDAFSIVFGAAMFMGREFLTDMSVNPIAYGNRCNGPECGPTYKNSTTPGLGIVRDRDEIFFKLRYTF
ncbi:MAG: hypothetical protein VX574_09730 [Myxococcota bacterium]|nr:hypothetical protein [Myxococcota bacterium]